jgi:hypothetical protein
MAWRIAFALLVVASVARASDDFPYTAFVESDEVYIRSGPADTYYPVLKLPRGAKVEVYRHDPGGWYAIRPPEGSFSWISGEFIEPGNDNLGIVKGERVVARVGSAFSDVRDVIQVRLDRGEEVEILEAKRFGSGPGAQTWYKIAPPAGEFRWVAGKFVVRDLPVAVPRERGPQNNLILARLDRGQRADSSRVGDESDDDQPADVAPPSRARRGVEDGASPDAKPEPRHSSPLRLRNSQPEDLTADDHPAAEARTASRDQPTVTAHETHLKPLAEELDDMDLELSSIVAGEPNTWDFRSLQLRADAALARADGAADRGQARVLLGKIARFDDIRRRYMAVMGVRGTAERRDRELSAQGSSRPARPFTDDPRYDGAGKLAQVVSGKAGVPRYALLDETGEVRYYITPAPGVNLRNYVGRQVGVNGTLGFIPDEQRQHVTARSIVVTDGSETKLR